MSKVWTFDFMDFIPLTAASWQVLLFIILPTLYPHSKYSCTKTQIINPYQIPSPCPIINYRTTFSWLGLNTPWIHLRVYEPYSPLPLLRHGGFTLKYFDLAV